MMTDQYDIMDWFPEPLSDEAAHAIYLFLQEFTMAFEGHYFAQIIRYIDDAKHEHESELHLDPPPLDRDDPLPF